MKLSLILQAIDRWTAPTNKAAGATRGLTGAMAPLGRAAATASGDVDRLGGRATGAGGMVGKLSDRVEALRRSAAEAGAPIGASGASLDRLAGSAEGAGSALASTGEDANRLGKDLDEAERPAERLSDRLKEVSKDGAEAGRSADRAGDRLRRFASDGEYAERVGYRLGAAIRRTADRDFAALRRRAGAAGAAIRAASLEAAQWGARQVGSTLKWGALGVAGGAAAGAGLFARGVIGNGAKFEQYQVALESTEGSARKAAAAMQWVQKFAQATPYDIDTVTDAFVRARGIGLDPMTGAFRTLGDAAGATRKTLMDAVEMMADAQTGEFERLKEFNITSSVKGNQVTFSYLDKAGKTAKKTVKKDMAEIRGAILGVFNDKYAGGMERQARTLTGIWSNLQDTITNFELSVAGKGIFDRVKRDLQGVLDLTSRWQTDGSFERWATRASDVLTKLWDRSEHFIKDTDWGAVADGVAGVTNAFITLLGWVGKAIELTDRLARTYGAVERVAQQQTISPSLKFMFTPLWGEDSPYPWAAGGQRKSQATGRGSDFRWPGGNFAKGPGGWARQQTIDNGWKRGLSGEGGQPKAPATLAPPRTPAASALAPQLAWPRAAARPAPAAPPTWPRAVPGASARAAPAAPAKPGRVAIDLRLSGPAADQAQTRRIATSGDVDVRVSRGQAMGGPA